MLPGMQTGNHPRDCMFPWSIPEAVDPATDRDARDEIRTCGVRERDESGDEVPIAYRAWFAQHTEEVTPA